MLKSQYIPGKTGMVGRYVLCSAQQQCIDSSEAIVNLTRVRLVHKAIMVHNDNVQQDLQL